MPGAGPRVRSPQRQPGAAGCLTVGRDLLFACAQKLPHEHAPPQYPGLGICGHLVGLKRGPNLHILEVWGDRGKCILLLFSDEEMGFVLRESKKRQYLSDLFFSCLASAFHNHSILLELHKIPILQILKYSQWLSSCILCFLSCACILGPSWGDWGGPGKVAAPKGLHGGGWPSG